MRRFSNKSALLAICGFVALAGFVAVRGQEADPVFRADTRLVVLHASVVNNKGQLVNNLPQSAFKVYENGVEQPIKIFRREEVPVSLGLLIDNSGSMRDKRGRVEQAALALVKSTNKIDEVFIVNFNDEAYLDVPMTGDLKRLEEGLARIDSRGATAFRDALDTSIDYIKDKGKRDKKVLLLLTDGEDTASRISLERVVTRVQQSGVLVYAIGLLSDSDRREAKRAKRALDALTTASGGVSYYPENTGLVDKTALQVSQDIRNQYVVAYSPTKQELDGSFRQVRVQAKGPDKPVVRTRTGYYATPDLAEPKNRPSSVPSAEARPATTGE